MLMCNFTKRLISVARDLKQAENDTADEQIRQRFSLHFILLSLNTNKIISVINHDGLLERAGLNKVGFFSRGTLLLVEDFESWRYLPGGGSTTVPGSRRLLGLVSYDGA